MSEPDKTQSEWGQLMEERRPIWDDWNKVMNRLTLAFVSTGIPSQEDLDLEETLKMQLGEVEAKMDKLRTKLRGGNGS